MKKHFENVLVLLIRHSLGVEILNVLNNIELTSNSQLFMS